MTRSKKFSPLLFVAALFAVLIGYIELRLPVRVDAQGRDGVYDSLAVTDTGESAVRVAGGVSVNSTAAGALDVAGGIVAGSGNVQVVKADGFVPQTALSMASSEASTTSRVLHFNVHRYTFLPRLSSSSNPALNCNIGGNPYGTDVGKYFWLHENNDSQSRLLLIGTGTVTCTVYWDYLATSDNPRIWIVMASDGTVGSIWESEDPAGSDPPISVPQDAQGNDLPGFTVVNIGLPSLSVIEALYATLPLAQRTAALTCTGDYVESRGWLTEFSTLTNLGGIEARYEPSGRQWAVRCAADAKDQSVTMLYLDELIVTAGAWALKP